MKQLIYNYSLPIGIVVSIITSVFGSWAWIDTHYVSMCTFNVVVESQNKQLVSLNHNMTLLMDHFAIKGIEK